MNARDRLIHDQQPFLRAYRPRFQTVFVRVVRVLAPGRGDPEGLATAADELYDRCFLETSEAPITPPPALEALGIESAPILSKCFSVMTAEFVAHAVKGGEVVEPVHTLTTALRELLATLDHPAEHHTPDEQAVVRMVMEHAGEAFTLRHGYAGVEVTERATLRGGDVLRGTLALALPEGHRLAIESGDRLALRAPFLPRPLLARAASLDEERGVLTLDGITEAERAAQPRNGVRVQPPTPVEVTVSARDGSRTGRLADLSVGGLSLVADEALPWSRGAWLHVRFILPSVGRAEPANVDARAELVGGGQGGAGYRYGLRLMPNLHEEQAIGEYVNHLQTEVIRRIQPEVPRPLYAPEHRRRPLPKAVSALIALNLILLFVGLLYYAAGQRQGNPTGIDRVAELLSIQERCDTLAERHAASGNPADAEKFEACRRKLEEARGRTNWQR